MLDLGFSSCIADPEVCMCAAMNPYDYNYWEYLNFHYDDLIVISHQSNLVMKGFDTA